MGHLTTPFYYENVYNKGSIRFFEKIKISEEEKTKAASYSILDTKPKINLKKDEHDIHNR